VNIVLFDGVTISRLRASSNGPSLAKVKQGIYSLPQLAAALWHGVLASGVLPQDLIPPDNPFDFGLTLAQALMAPGWQELPQGLPPPRAPLLRLPAPAMC